jgi:hypothetical protein
MSAYTDAAAALISQRNRLDAEARDLTDAAAALITAENAEHPVEAPAPA